MITSFFSKSKPINLIIAVTIMVLTFILKLLYNYYTSQILNLNTCLITFFISLLTVFLVDFITKKNNLSAQSDYTLMWYSLCFILLIKEFNLSILVCHLLILLSIRKIISLKSQKEVTKKIFDASLWIFIATLFNFWCVSYLGVLLFSILFYVNKYLTFFK